jgi:rhodanese-related sulfurtransferase
MTLEGPTNAEELLRASRARLRRLTPAEAWEALRSGAALVDIRSEAQRERDGVVPGSRFIPRNVLEWRLDPASSYRDQALARPEGRVVLMCNEGYQSSLAAATLQRFGLTEATDVIGGFQAWLQDGLPTEEAPPPPAGPPHRTTP